MRFRDRVDAGRRLTAELRARHLDDPVVLALPRGGVPVGFEVASGLGAPFDVFVARKIGAPGRREYGIGAIAEGGGLVVDRSVLRLLGVSDHHFELLVTDEQSELRRRVREYRGDRELPKMAERDVILVDDGLATGVTAEASLHALRLQRPRQLVLAVPVCPAETARRLVAVADDVAAVMMPRDFYAVGQWYEDFTQTTDDEVLALLQRAAHPSGSSAAP